jgi:hypothetical protein
MSTKTIGLRETTVSLHTCEIILNPLSVKEIQRLFAGEKISANYCNKPAFEKYRSSNRGSLWVCDEHLVQYGKEK